MKFFNPFKNALQAHRALRQQHRDIIVSSDRNSGFNRPDPEELEWGVFDSSARKYITFFDFCFRAERPNPSDKFLISEIKHHINTLKSEGKKIAIVDIMGTANGKDIGADLAFNFNATQPEWIKKRQNENHIVVAGNVFSRRDQVRFLKEIKNRHATPCYIFFRPLRGIEIYANNEYAYQALFRFFDRLYGILDNDGEIFAEIGHFAHEFELFATEMEKAYGDRFISFGKKCSNPEEGVAGFRLRKAVGDPPPRIVMHQIIQKILNYTFSSKRNS